MITSAVVPVDFKSMHLFKSRHDVWVLEDRHSNRMNFWTYAGALARVIEPPNSAVKIENGSLVLDPLHPRTYPVSAEDGLEEPCPVCARKWPSP